MDKSAKEKELENNWKRALADYQNLEKRVREEKAEWISFANKNLLLKILPLLEALEKAQEHLKDEGLNLIIRQFKDLLQNEGVEEIKARGEKFNPLVHESVEVEEGDEEGKISEVFSKGYLLKGKLLTPAKVKVIKKK